MSSSAYFAALAWPHHNLDRHLRPRDVSVTLQNRPVLGALEVEREHDAMGAVHHVAPGPREERAEPAVLGPVAHDDVVARALEERTIELAPGAWRDVKQDQPKSLGHRSTPLPGFYVNVPDLGRRRQGRRSLERLKKSLKTVKSTTVWNLLVDLMELDTKKHQLILRFLEAHPGNGRVQPRRPWIPAARCHISRGRPQPSSTPARR